MESVLYSIVGFLLATGILVTLHEWGHYWVGRWCGVKVLSFSIGFGRTLWSRRLGPDNTEWKLSAIPLGGYVQFLSERDDTHPVPLEEKHRAFENRKAWQRIAIIAAGPITNLLTAIALYTVVFSVGIEQDRARFAIPEQKSLMAQAGVREAGELIAWDGHSIHSLQDLQWLWFKQLGRAEGQTTLEMRTQQGTVKPVTIARSALPQHEDFSKWLETLGMEPDMPSMPSIVGEILPGHPAQQAGLKPGDQILQIAGKPIHQWRDILETLKPHAGHSIDLVFSRDGHEQHINLVPEAALESGGKTVGKIGIAPKRIQINRADYRVVVRYGPIESIGRAAYKTYELSHMTLLALYKMASGQLSLKNISGPVTMADLAGQSLQAGWIIYLNYLGLISVSLGIMNLLPIPVLDGGHIVYETFALLRGGRPITVKWLAMGQKVGLLMLGALMVLAFYNDWHRFFK